MADIYKSMAIIINIYNHIREAYVKIKYTHCITHIIQKNGKQYIVYQNHTIV